MVRTRKIVQDLARDEDGAAIVEYALLLALIVLVLVAAATLLGSHISNFFSSAATSI
jgi:pilus assembly protein Flp/PilA